MKKKLLLGLLALAGCASLALGLAACDKNDDSEGASKPTLPENHSHSMTYHQRVEPTCTSAGNVAYWSCLGCHKNFADKAGNNLLAEVTVNATGHKVTYHSEVEAGCTTAGNVAYWSCSSCGKNFMDREGKITLNSVTVAATGHHYVNHVCTCGATDPTWNSVELRAEQFTREGNNLFTKVSNDTETFSFRSGIEVEEGAIYRIYSDLQCKNEIASKTDNLKIGDNTFYILVTNRNDLELYTAVVRRRPVYTVKFNSNGGSAVETQYVEEDGFVKAPLSTKLGYLLDGWDYDFSSPVVKNETVAALWSPCQYKISFDLSDGEELAEQNFFVAYDANYTLPIPVKDGHTFLGWYEGTTKLTNADGSSRSSWKRLSGTTVTAQWNINQYNFSISCDAVFGSATGTQEGKYKYGSDISATVTTQRNVLGYEWLGWYDGENLLSEELTYTGKLPSHDVVLTATWGPLPEMQPFEFTATTLTCTITGLKDKSLTQIAIPDCVTSIGEWAFSGCSGLTSVTIGNSVTSIGYGAFYRCSGLTSVTIGNSVTSIGEWAFSGCSGLTSVTIGNSVTSIGRQAFYRCSGLTSITIPDSVTSIGNEAFYNCSGLTSITIPDSVTSMGSSAFFGCSGLTSATAPAWAIMAIANGNNITTFVITVGTTIRQYAFKDCSKLTSVTIPDSVTSIGEKAFYNCSGLTSITIPDSVTSMGEYAFYGCSGLTSITIPDSVTSMGKAAFYDCSGLTSVTIGNSVTSIGEWAFENCRKLTSVTIGNSVTSIGRRAFENCSGLTSITIPDSVTSIREYAFLDCSSLTSVTIGSGVTSIGEYAFQNCSSLTSVTFVDTEARWYVSTLHNPITGSAIADPITMAEYLRDVYVEASWRTQ